MDIFCPACQKKLQIADSAAGQAVKCPYCSATFAAPALPTMAPVPAPEQVAPPTPEIPSAGAPFNFAPEHTEPKIPVPDAGLAKPQAAPNVPKGNYSRDCTISFRQHIVTLIAPVGVIVLFILSFFPWRFTEWTPPNPAFALAPATAVETVTTLNPLVALNLWVLGFTHEGFTTFTYYVFLMILAALLLLATTILGKNQMLAPANLRPFLPWVPTLSAFVLLVAWLLFLAHYLHCIFINPLDPATIWMKVAFRVHTLVVIGAWLDVWLERRKLRQLPEPFVHMRW